MIDQQIEIEDLSTEKKFFTQIPNIIYKMGLGPYVVAYYCLLKAIAGETGACFISQKNICDMLGCSERQIRLMNAFMSQPFAILGGKPLIKIKHRTDKNGGKTTNLIQITDIWLENVHVLSSGQDIPKTPMPVQPKKDNLESKSRFEKPCSKRTASHSPPPASDSAPPASDSAPPASSADKEEPSSKNQVKKTYLKDLGLTAQGHDNPPKAEHLKTEVRKKDPVKTEVLTKDPKRRWSLTKPQSMSFDFLSSKDIDADDAKLAFWSKAYSYERLLEVYHEAKHYQPKSMRLYMNHLLEKNKKVTNAQTQQNREFLITFLKSNYWPCIEVKSKCFYYQIGSEKAEMSFDVDPNVFMAHVWQKYESCFP